MKKISALIMMILICIGISSMVMAEDNNHTNDAYYEYADFRRWTYTDPDGTEYTYCIEDDTVAIIEGYNHSKLREITLPNKIDGMSVKKIISVFKSSGNEPGNDPYVEKITVPDSVELIGNQAFGLLSNLKTVVLSDNLKTITDSAFRECTSLKNITLPNSLTSIGPYAFEGCESLKSIKIPDSVGNNVGERAFLGCDGLETVTLPKNMTYINEYMFSCCYSLKTINWPDNLDRIKVGAFHSSGIEEVSIPKSVSFIGSNAFSNSKLKKLTLLGTPKMNDVAFTTEYLTDIEGLSVTDLRKYWSAFKNTPYSKNYTTDNYDESFVINDGVLEGYIGTNMDVVIPNTVKKIGSKAFLNKKITSLTIPESVEIIEQTACNGTDITELTIPSSVYYIGNYAFSGNKKLKTLTIEKGRRSVSIKSFAFLGCDALELITVPEGSSIHESAFGDDRISDVLTSTGVYKKATPVPSPSPEPTSTPNVLPTPTISPSPAPQVLEVSNDGEINISIDGKAVEFDTKPFIDENERTQVPIRAVAEMLKANVDWDGETQNVTISKGGKIIKIVIGSDAMTVDGKTVKMDTAAIIRDNRTYIPVRFIAEALGLEVTFVS